MLDYKSFLSKKAGDENMEGCTFKRKVDKTIITYRLTSHDQISSSELNALQQNTVAELLPVTIKKGLFGTKLQYEAVDCLQLSSRLEQRLDFADFCAIVRNSIMAFKHINKNFRLNAVELETDKVFCNFATGKMQFIYWPLVSANQYSNIGDYFRRIGEQYLCEENSGGIKGKSEYLSLFEHMYTFNLSRFEQSFTSMTGKWMGTQGSVKWENDENSSHKKGLNQDDGGRSRTAPMNFERNSNPTPKQQESIFDESWHTVPDQDKTDDIWHTDYIENGNGDVPTDVDSSNTDFEFQSTRSNPIVRRMSTGEISQVRGSRFIIGRSPNQADMIISGNSKISNIHATIICKGGKYYLEDSDSKNGTFMNGERLIPHEAVELFDSAEFRLFNEQFFFEYQKEESTWNY